MLPRNEESRHTTGHGPHALWGLTQSFREGPDETDRLDRSEEAVAVGRGFRPDRSPAQGSRPLVPLRRWKPRRGWPEESLPRAAREDGEEKLHGPLRTRTRPLRKVQASPRRLAETKSIADRRGVPKSREDSLVDHHRWGCAWGCARLPRSERLARHDPQTAHLSRARRDARRRGNDGMNRALTLSSHHGREPAPLAPHPFSSSQIERPRRLTRRASSERLPRRASMAAPRRLPLSARWRHALVVEPGTTAALMAGILRERDCPQTVEPEGTYQATPLELSRLTLRPGA
eukprot:scaffold2151_cov99-Isochrysis_galbana.AAC.4